jgi:predicted nucleic acid-binding protein
MERSKEINIIADSSVIIKWFSDEMDTDKALALLELHNTKEHIIVLPDLVLYEVANALRYNKDTIEKDIIDFVESIATMEAIMVFPTKLVMNDAITLARKYNISLYDAYFVALAKTLRCPLVTADRKLKQKVNDLKYVHLLCEFV